MYNFASTIKSKHKYKILPAASQLSRYVLWNFAVTEKTICCRELHNLSALYPYIVSEHEIERQKVRQNFCRTEPNQNFGRFLIPMHKNERNHEIDVIKTAVRQVCLIFSRSPPLPKARNVLLLKYSVFILTKYFF